LGFLGGNTEWGKGFFKVWLLHWLLCFSARVSLFLNLFFVLQTSQLYLEGKRVIFVDAREDREFTEERIPGAINITLRDIPQYKNEIAQSGDIVVAYCLKDFRGYEVAKALKANGLENVYTMAVPGLNGWKASEFPTEGDRVFSKVKIIAKEKG